jgi:alkylation response protein AidB-like acyl-CoA dehydrogenase
MTVQHQATTPAAGPDEEFRARLRDFLASHHPGRPPKDPRARLAWTKAWLATLFDNGYAGPGWPREFGGMELSFARQVIYHEEVARARVPGPLGTGLGIAAPTIIRYGTQEQKQRWLAPMLRGDTVWAQGYSEPEAGSDLPSLRTTARREGEDYVVNGQKVWTSHAADADIFFALVRTGTRESRQKGITYLVIDARAPGVQVRPLRDLTGGHLFAEVFFDDVRVPAQMRIGEENDGWRLARTNPDAAKQAGISAFALDMRAPGVEVRPLREITGTTDFNEVFLAGVHIPASQVIGEVNDGWRVANASLAHERSGVGARAVELHAQRPALPRPAGHRRRPAGPGRQRHPAAAGAARRPGPRHRRDEQGRAVPHPQRNRGSR